MKTCFDNIQPERDIQDFILKTKSGEQPSPPDKFEPYTIKFEKELFLKESSSTVGGFSGVGGGIIVTGGGGASSNNPLQIGKINKIDSIGKDSVIAGIVLKNVCAIYDYNPSDNDEVKLTTGDVIEVYEMREDGW
jgi:hypothetical protein